MSEPMSEERRREIEKWFTDMAPCPMSLNGCDAECINAKLVCGNIAGYYAMVLLDEIDRQASELKHKNEQISLLKQQLHQQSDLIARMESQQKGGFW